MQSYDKHNDIIKQSHDNQIKTNIKCKYCKKIFSHRNNRWRHEKTCKYKEEIKVKEEIKILKEKIIKLESQNKNIKPISYIHDIDFNNYKSTIIKRTKFNKNIRNERLNFVPLSR